MERNQLCVANIRYKKPSADGARQAKNLLRYLTYRDSRDERAPQRGGRERWVDQGMGGSVADIADRCADLRSDHVLSFSLVINPNPDLITLLDQIQREQFVRELTERTVEGFFEARGIDTGIEYSYVTHRRLTDDPQAPGRANPHTHVVLPGTVYSEEHGARVPLYFSQNQRVNHIELLHQVTETEMAKLLTREVGRDWEERFDALEQVRAQERRVVERPADGRLAERAGQGTEFWIGTRQQNETHSSLGYYCLDSEGNTQFRTLVSGLPAQEAATLGRGLRAASHGDFQTYQEHIRTVQLLTPAQHAELCAEFGRIIPAAELSPSVDSGFELSL